MKKAKLNFEKKLAENINSFIEYAQCTADGYKYNEHIKQ